MSIEIPHDLIKEVQAAVLREVNLSSYDPDDASLISQLPSIETSFSEADPSPPHLRCIHCNGRLLRGTESMLCVFCGKEIAQQDVAPPQPIHFKSTFSCKWLLDALNLDGSDIVGEPVKGNESNRGRSSTEEGVFLSDYLDLKVMWNSKFEILGHESEKSFLSSIGVDVDDLMGETKVETVSAVPELHSQENKKDDGDDFQVRGDFSSVAKVEHSETIVRSWEEDKSGDDSFTGWEASFQSAGSKSGFEGFDSVQPAAESSVDLFESKAVAPVAGSSVNFFEGSNSVDPDMGSYVNISESKAVDASGPLSVGLSTHMDTVFGSGNSLFDENERGDEVSSLSNVSDWFQHEVSKHIHDGKTAGIADTYPSMSNWIQDDQFVQSDKLSNQEAVTEDDPFDAWNDFASSRSTDNTANEQKDYNKQFELDAVVDNSSLIGLDNKASEYAVYDDKPDPFDDWNDFTGSKSTQGPSTGQTGPSKQFEWNANIRDEKTTENSNSFSMNADWFQANEWQTNGNRLLDSKTIGVDDDPFDAWNDFTGSIAAKDSSVKQSVQPEWSGVITPIKDSDIKQSTNNSATVSWTPDDQVATAATIEKSGNEMIDDGDDLFDTWNDFTSSSNAQDLPNKLTGEAKPYEMTAHVKDYETVGLNGSSFDWFQGNELQTSSSAAPDKKTVDKDHDPFDPWNDFASLSGAQDLTTKQSVNQITPSLEQTTTNYLQDFDFGDFTQSQVFPGSMKDQNGSTEVNFMNSEPSVSDRSFDTKDGGNSGEEAAEGNVVTKTTRRSTANNVEMLISQMHDLSFMLETDLSVPQKQDESHSLFKG